MQNNFNYNNNGNKQMQKHTFKSCCIIIGIFLSVFLLGVFLGYIIRDSRADVYIIQNSSEKCNEEEEEIDLGFKDISFDKPIIYLYGYDNEKVTVSLDFDGELTCTYPKIKKGKWTVMAQKDGTLKIGENKYSYLYWEGRGNAKFDFSKGFCVKGSETEQFLEESLAMLGLNQKEINDFIVYWLPLMQNNEYNVIAFQDKEYTQIAKLDAKPAPKKTIRVYMAWYPSDEEIEIKAQNLQKTDVTRKTSDKIIVEWGGSQVNSSTYEPVDSFSNSSLDNTTLIKSLAALSTEELQNILLQTVDYKNTGNIQTDDLSKIEGNVYTDKNGNVYAFSDEEWAFLQKDFAFTGQSNSVIAQFTIDELKEYLKNNMKGYKTPTPTPTKNTK